jgi:nitrite reductase/ring-hydroxylating ferredoxin subunit
MTVRKTLCQVSDIPDGGAIAVEGGDAANPESIILLRQGQRVRAYRNECPHTGRRLDWSPGRFLTDGNQLVCAAHGACFQIDSGRCVSGPPRGDALAAVAVDVVDGNVVTAA